MNIHADEDTGEPRHCLAGESKLQPERDAFTHHWTNIGLTQFGAYVGRRFHSKLRLQQPATRRRTARKPGKNDSLDARAIALLVRQEVGSLPRVLPEDQTALLDLLTTERESAVVEATRLRNQIHAHPMQIDPEYGMKLPTLTSKAGLDALQSFAAPGSGLLKEQRALVVRQLAQRLRLAVLQAGELEKQIKELAEASFSP